MVRTSLNILQWNARGLGFESNKNVNPNSKINNLNKLIHDLNYPDVISIQEPLAKPNHKIHFPYYNHEVIFKGPNCRGLLTLIKNTHTYKILHNHSNRFITSQTFEIYINNQTKIHVTNYYRNWENKNNTIRNVQNIENLLGAPLKLNLTNHFIVGDFNAHSLRWGSRQNTKIGKIFTKILEENDLALHNSGESTRIGQRANESDSTIDLTISENLEGITVHDYKVIQDDMGSDHLPIQLNCAASVRNNYTPPTQTHFRTNRANWDDFRSKTEKFKWDTCRHSDIEIYSNHIINAFTQLAKECIPHTNPESIKPIPKNAGRSVPWFDEECRAAKNDKINARQIWQTTRTPENLERYKILRNKSTKLINKKQKDFFRKNCSELNEQTKEGEVWKVVSSMEGRQKQGPNTVILRDSEGRDVISNKDKANLLGKHYENISADSNLDSDFLRKKNRHKIDNPHLFQKQENNIRDPINHDFSMQELLGTLRKKKNSAPGEDGISYDILKNAHIFAIREILRLFNIIWDSGNIPKLFKHAIVVPILKPNKPKTDPASYRPISLTSHLGKILETMFTNRLQQKLEAYRKLNKLQSGFRKKRQTLDQLAKLIHNAEKSRNMNKTTVAVLLDLEKAFDLLWREGALDALQKLNISGRAFNYIQDFLKNRTFQVRVGESLSDTKIQENGVP